jgi:hypothetical protein
MAITTITSTKNGKGSIDYVLKGRKEDKRTPEERTLAVRGHNLDPTRAAEQMSAVWRNFGKDDGNTIQTYRIIQSFRETDFDKDNYLDIEKANEIGLALAEKLYPNRQALIVTQADGEGGKVHNHIIVNSVEPVAGKSLRGIETSWEKTISKANDEVLKEHKIKALERGTLRDVAYSRSELSIITDKTASWKDTIRDAVEDSISEKNITSIEDLKEKLKDDYDIELKLRGNTITYAGTFNISKDEENPKFVERKVRATKLGNNYTLEGLNHGFRENEKQRQRETTNKLSTIERIEPTTKDSAAVQLGKSEARKIDEGESFTVGAKSNRRSTRDDKSKSKSVDERSTTPSTVKSPNNDTRAIVAERIRAIQERKQQLEAEKEQRELERIEQQNQRIEQERRRAEQARIREQNRRQRRGQDGPSL